MQCYVNANAVRLISSKDIPLNAGTSTLVQFIQKLQGSTTDKDIDELFNSEEGPAFEQIVNDSQWDIHCRVNTTN